jgi:prolyl oligopeptidase
LTAAGKPLKIPPDAGIVRVEMRRFTCLLAGLLAMTAAYAADGGMSVEDPYQWLEDVHGGKSLVWVKDRNAKSLGVLKGDARYQPYYDSVLKVLDATDRIPYVSLDRGLAYNFWQDKDHPKGILRRTSVAEYARQYPAWTVLLDVDRLAADEKENWVYHGVGWAPGMIRGLVNLSRGGGDAAVVREYDFAAGAFVKDGFSLPEAKSVAVMMDENTVYFGTDFGPGSLTTSGYPRIVKVWHRGEKIADAKTVLEGKDTDVSVSAFYLTDGGVRLPVLNRAPTFFTSEYYLAAADGSWWKIPLPLSAELRGLHKGQLLFSLREDWTAPNGGKFKRGALYAVPLDELVKTRVLPKAAALYVPGPRASLEDVETGRDAVYLALLNNVVGEVRAFRLKDGRWTDKKLNLPAGGSAGIVATDDFGSEAHFTFQSFLQPPTLYADEGRDTPEAIKSLPARFDSAGLVAEQFAAKSKDGTKIPYFVVRSQNTAGPRPTVLYGYGGFEVSETPSYMTSFGMLWLARGGSFVLANIRGGGEFGPGWHQAALKENRQKAFDDFAAVAADIEKRGLTTPKQLGIMGGSNGGLLVSTVMTQIPEKLGAVVCQVPLIDMIAYTHIGAGASWIDEYGDPADAKMRAAILKYSPYQNVSEKKKYPPVFFVTATSDDRVTPVHARKMAAKMEAQGHDVLFYENTDGGHAAAADHKQSAEMSALSFVYLAKVLGLK